MYVHVNVTIVLYNSEIIFIDYFTFDIVSTPHVGPTMYCVVMIFEY